MHRVNTRLAVAILIASASVIASAAQAAAGRSAGSFNVSQSGAATYSMPIWVPPGPRGMQPSLAIVYSSQSGDGIMGPGWNLAGLSSISRCNKTFKEDTTPAPVYLATTDGYCFNGNRLRVTSGTYGAAGSTYQTEIADFSLVTANGTMGNGPSSFTVKGKNGLIYEYGNTTDSRILYGATAGQWLLNKVSDRSGNNYIVSYGTGAAGSAAIGVPLSFSYTPSSAGSGNYNYTVAFAYGARVAQNSNTIDPAIVGYVGGVPTINTNLLLSVSVSSSSSGSSVLVRKYTMAYGTAPVTARARLTSLTECGGSAGTDCLAPTTMSYQDGQLGISSTANTAVSYAPQNYVDSKYDFNGDGYTDILYYNGTTWMVAFGSASGFGTPVNTGAAGAGLPGDMLGNGRDGILAVNGSAWYYYTWTGTAFAGVSTGLASDAAVALADINGDGLPDLVYFSSVYGVNGSITIKSRLNTSAGATVSFSPTLNAAWSYSGGYVGSATLYHSDLPYMGPVRFWDFDGDGREDLALVWKDTSTVPATWNYWALLGNGTTLGDAPFGSSTATTPPTLKFLNWNNDACTDTQYGNSILISGCGGSEGSAITLPSATYLAAADWNGDGRTDVLVVNGATIGVYLSTSTGFSSLISTSIPYSSTCAYYTFDANADGLDDLMCWDQGGTRAVKYFLHNGSGQPSDFLTSVTDGFGMAQSPTYVPLTQNNYSKYSDGAYPDKDFIGPLYVVNQFSASDGTGSNFTNSFWYYGAHANLQGLGFDGFKSMRTLDSRNSIYRYQYYERDFPKRGML